MTSDETELCCPQCGYSLKGLPAHRCPECGQTFVPELLAVSNLTLRAGGIWSRRFAIQFLGFIAFLVCSPFAAAIAADITRAGWAMLPLSWLLAMAINSYTLSTYTVEAQRRAGARKPETVWMLMGVIICFHFLVMWVVGMLIMVVSAG